ncbi:MAG: YegS/Rv2252/BmrU family lipid kinase [Spirochaetaceae bacterium]|jgi:YegS/Rv2252/BmrU family lipid kinase|nr:YegS/Rv2252/BmrU family lipid kinase [Spirochaetaceae bacterium]
MISPKKFDTMLIILNPIAGRGKAAREQSRIEQFFTEREQTFKLIQTATQGDAQRLLSTYPLTEKMLVVAAGEDGTCNEVVNGIVSRSLPTPPLFGVIPVGRGNDFAFNAGIPETVPQALQALINCRTIPLDVGIVKGGFFPEGRYFINGVGVGFDTKVGFEAAKMKIKSGFSYVLGALITVIKYEPSPVLEIRYDDHRELMPAAIVSIMNGRRMGGSFIMGPHALINDGAFDICIVRHQLSRLKLLNIVLKYPKGTQGNYEGVTMGRAKQFSLKALEGGMASHCDGETVCYDGKELCITVIPQALRLVSSTGSEA